jgi:hypothetical protein
VPGPETLTKRLRTMSTDRHGPLFAQDLAGIIRKYRQ